MEAASCYIGDLNKKDLTKYTSAELRTALEKVLKKEAAQLKSGKNQTPAQKETDFNRISKEIDKLKSSK